MRRKTLTRRKENGIIMHFSFSVRSLPIIDYFVNLGREGSLISLSLILNLNKIT